MSFRWKNHVIAPIIILFSGIAVSQDSYTEMRHAMVEGQIKARGISDKATLNAMIKVPRHEFVLPGFISSAYLDTPLPIGHKQTISQPYIVAYMTAALKLKPEFKVLEIGTGSGYQAAILAEIVDSVYTIEIVEPLGLEARKRLKDLGYGNVEVRIGDGYAGWPEKAPFNAIMVTAAVETIPQPLLDQLKIGGKLIIPVGPVPEFRVLQLVTRRKSGFKTRNLIPVRFVPFTRNNKD